MQRCRRHVLAARPAPALLEPGDRADPLLAELLRTAAPGMPSEEMRKICIARIKTRLKRIYAGKKNAGRSLFELSEYVACLTVIDSRN